MSYAESSSNDGDFEASDSDAVIPEEDASSSDDSSLHELHSGKVKRRRMARSVAESPSPDRSVCGEALPSTSLTAEREEREVSDDAGEDQYLDISTARGASSTQIKVRPFDQVKVNYCLYCQNSFPKIARHLLSVHKDELDVKAVLDLPKRSSSRLEAVEIIRNRGNYLHNVEVIDIGEGDIVFSRRTKNKDHSLEGASLCPHCMGLFQKDTVHRHAQRCPKKGTDLPKGLHTAPIGAELLSLALKPDTEYFTKGILRFMKKDKLFDIVKKDSSIVLFGTGLDRPITEAKTIFGTTFLRSAGSWHALSKQQGNWDTMYPWTSFLIPKVGNFSLKRLREQLGTTRIPESSQFHR